MIKHPQIKLNILITPIVFFIASFIIPGCSKSESRINPDTLAKIPVLHEGRIKPLDTFARVHLLAFHGKSKLKGISQMAWLLELLLDQDKAYERPIFKIRNPDTVAAYKLKENQDNIYNFRELSVGLQANMTAINKLQRIPKEQRSPTQNEMIHIAQGLMLYYEISRSMSLVLPEFIVHTDKLADTLGLEKGKTFTYMQIYGKQRAMQKIAKSLYNLNIKNVSAYQQDILLLGKKMQFMDSDSRAQIFRIIPPQWEDDKDRWYSPWSLVSQGRGSVVSARYLKLWQKLASSYRNKDQKIFNESAASLLELSEKTNKDKVSVTRLELEYIYNKMDFFTLSLISYLFSFLVLMISWMYKPDLTRKISYYSFLFGLLLHAIGLVFRVYIMSRPPVSTLYESIIFVGFIGSVSGILLERIKRNGIGIMIGSLMGAALHFIGFGYAADGDSMGMLVAVLNTNFWLATHVVTITIGYGSCLVGGFIGHIYLVKRLLHPDNKTELADLYKIMLGVSLVSLFFSMFGTILGGIWADQSWGRFWGWDPKENGALLICLWLLFIIHGRLAGYYKGTGFAMGLVFNNIIVAVAWFGVNLLNIGLHSYGFTDSIALNLALFCGAELLFIIVMYTLIYRKTKMETNIQAGG